MKRIETIILVLIMLSSLGFYNPMGILSAQNTKLLFYITSLVGFVYVTVFGTPINNHHFPTRWYFSLLVAIVTSTIMASLFHPQPWSDSLISTLRFLFGYLNIYTFLRLDLPKDKQIKLLFGFCCLSMIVFIVNRITFPNTFFGDILDEDKVHTRAEIIQLKIPSIELIVLLFLYSLNHLKNKYSIKYLVISVVSSSLIIASLTRQVIALSFLMAALLLMTKTSFLKKGIIFIVLVLFIGWGLPKIPLFSSLIDITKEQIINNEKEEEDIRIKAWRFYTSDFQTNSITPLLGNGVASYNRSPWGKKVESITSINRCYAVDVGWAGFFWYFGLFATICLVAIFIKAAKTSFSEQNYHLGYWIFFIALTSFASGPILYYYQITSLAFVLSIIYGEKSRHNYSELQ